MGLGPNAGKVKYQWSHKNVPQTLPKNVLRRDVRTFYLNRMHVRGATNHAVSSSEKKRARRFC